MRPGTTTRERGRTITASGHIGEVGNNPLSLPLPSPWTCHARHVLADSQEVASALRVANGEAVLQSIVLNDKDDQGKAMDLVFLSANVSIGTENTAVSSPTPTPITSSESSGFRRRLDRPGAVARHQDQHRAGAHKRSARPRRHWGYHPDA
jgi:hypothetical protein